MHGQLQRVGRRPPGLEPAVVEDAETEAETEPLNRAPPETVVYLQAMGVDDMRALLRPTGTNVLCVGNSRTGKAWMLRHMLSLLRSDIDVAHVFTTQTRGVREEWEGVVPECCLHKDGAANARLKLDALHNTLRTSPDYFAVILYHTYALVHQNKSAFHRLCRRRPNRTLLHVREPHMAESADVMLDLYDVFCVFNCHHPLTQPDSLKELMVTFFGSAEAYDAARRTLADFEAFVIDRRAWAQGRPHLFLYTAPAEAVELRFHTRVARPLRLGPLPEFDPRALCEQPALRVLCVGERGAGKTTLLRHLLRCMRHELSAVYAVCPPSEVWDSVWFSTAEATVRYGVDTFRSVQQRINEWVRHAKSARLAKTARLAETVRMGIEDAMRGRASMGTGCEEFVPLHARKPFGVVFDEALLTGCEEQDCTRAGFFHEAWRFAFRAVATRNVFTEETASAFDKYELIFVFRDAQPSLRELFFDQCFETDAEFLDVTRRLQQHEALVLDRRGRGRGRRGPRLFTFKAAFKKAKHGDARKDTLLPPVVAFQPRRQSAAAGAGEGEGASRVSTSPHAASFW
jgi:hypothetical protein